MADDKKRMIVDGIRCPMWPACRDGTQCTYTDKQAKNGTRIWNGTPNCYKEPVA